MKYYLIVVGTGRERHIKEYYTVRRLAILALNHQVLDLNENARLIVTSIRPPFEAGPRSNK